MLRLLPEISSLLIYTLPVHSLAFFRNLSRYFPVLAVADAGSCVGQQNQTGHLAHRYGQWMQVPVLTARGIIVLGGLRSEIVDII